uniref:Uncharacterized protein n=1 Tax=Anguilla anguilla TaxID=7936 RepID=A0A0E9XL60_ANGAN
MCMSCISSAVLTWW